MPIFCAKYQQEITISHWDWKIVVLTTFCIYFWNDCAKQEAINRIWSLKLTINRSIIDIIYFMMAIYKPIYYNIVKEFVTQNIPVFGYMFLDDVNDGEFNFFSMCEYVLSIMKNSIFYNKTSRKNSCM